MTIGSVTDWDPARSAPIMLIFDPETLSRAQRDGEACVVCHGRWPRPRVRVGRLPDSGTVRACRDCVAIIRPAASGDVAAPPSRPLTALP